MRKSIRNNVQTILNAARELVSMANFGTYCGFRFFIWSADTNENRMHIHAAKDGKIAKFWLEPSVELADDGKMSDVDLNKCKKVVIQHLDEFKQKFSNELKKRNASKNKRAFIIDKTILEKMPLVSALVKKLNEIKNVICDNQNMRCAIEFRRKSNVEPWIEIVYNKRSNIQNIHFELQYNGRCFEFNKDVQFGNENEIADKIKNWITLAQSGKQIQ